MTSTKAASSRSRQANVWFIFVTILLDAIGIGLLIPVLPDVLRRFSSDSEFVARYFAYFIASYALMQFIASPVLGSLSDRFGRKPILLISLLGAGLDYLFMAFAPSLGLLFVGRIVSGLTGASMTVASSYMADISNDQNRSSNFGLIGAAWGGGFIAGPLLGGLLGALGPQAPFIGAAILNLVNFAFGVAILPESLAKESRRQVRLKQLNPAASLLRVLKPSPIVGLIYIYFLLFLAGNVHPVNWTLYTQTKFHWSSWEVGLSLSFVGLMIALSQGLMTRLLIPRLGESRALTLGIWVYVVAFGLFAVASRSWMMYVITAFFSLTGMAIPALQSIIARHTLPNQQGELQGSLVSLASLATIIAPLIYTPLFVAFTREDASVYFPGAAYAGAAAICLFAVILRHFTRA